MDMWIAVCFPKTSTSVLVVHEKRDGATNDMLRGDNLIRCNTARLTNGLEDSPIS